MLRYLAFAEDTWPREPGCAYGHINIVSSKITIRGVQAMLDGDIASFFQVSVKLMNRQMKRNPDRFPEDFCFQLTKEEILRSQFATSSSWGGHRGRNLRSRCKRKEPGSFPRRLLLPDYQRRTRSLKVTNCYLYGKNARSQISPLRFYRAGDHRPYRGVALGHSEQNGGGDFPRLRLDAALHPRKRRPHR